MTQPNYRATNVENKANRRYLSVDVDSQNCVKLRLPTSRVRRANAARTHSLAGTAFSGTGAAQTTVICCRYRWLLTQTGQFTTNPNRICHKSISAFFFLRSATPLYLKDSNFNVRTTTTNRCLAGMHERQSTWKALSGKGWWYISLPFPSTTFISATLMSVGL